MRRYVTACLSTHLARGGCGRGMSVLLTPASIGMPGWNGLGEIQLISPVPAPHGGGVEVVEARGTFWATREHASPRRSGGFEALLRHGARGSSPPMLWLEGWVWA